MKIVKYVLICMLVFGALLTPLSFAGDGDAKYWETFRKKLGNVLPGNFAVSGSGKYAIYMVDPDIEVLPNGMRKRKTNKPVEFYRVEKGKKPVLLCRYSRRNKETFKKFIVLDSGKTCLACKENVTHNAAANKYDRSSEIVSIGTRIETITALEGSVARLLMIPGSKKLVYAVDGDPFDRKARAKLGVIDLEKKTASACELGRDVDFLHGLKYIKDGDDDLVLYRGQSNSRSAPMIFGIWKVGSKKSKRILKITLRPHQRFSTLAIDAKSRMIYYAHNKPGAGYVHRVDFDGKSKKRLHTIRKAEIDPLRVVEEDDGQFVILKVTKYSRDGKTVEMKKMSADGKNIEPYEEKSK